MCCLINHIYMHSFRSIIEATENLNSNLVIFPEVGAFEQLFGPVRGEFEKTFFKNSNAWGVDPWGGGRVLKLLFDWYASYFLVSYFVMNFLRRIFSVCHSFRSICQSGRIKGFERFFKVEDQGTLRRQNLHVAILRQPGERIQKLSFMRAIWRRRDPSGY